MNMTYDDYIKSKQKTVKNFGFEPLPFIAPLFDWQKQIVAWAVKKGRAALFEDCGLGKTAQQLEWASQVVRHTRGRVLILTPLAVAAQTMAEGVKFGIETKVIESPDDLDSSGIFITNYEKLEKFDSSDFVGVVLDESSILKNFMGKTRIALTKAFESTPYKLACTATPAPNDYMEFGQHCEFLSVMPSNEMLCRWFINDTMNFGSYRIKGHADSDFWDWVGTWAACVSSPSDIGFDGSNYILPALNLHQIVVDVDDVEGAEDGELFRSPELNATTIHKEMRFSCEARAKATAELVNNSSEAWIVWCNTNYEADELSALLNDAVEVRGSDSNESKIKKLTDFQTGAARVIISKPSICGFGLNWQHCRNIAFVGLSYSFEDFYQALRRSYRFGQTQQVNAYIISGKNESQIISTVQNKMDAHRKMQERMKKASKALRNEKEKELKMNMAMEITEGNGFTVYNGDCVRVAKQLQDDSIDFSIYSPPFANLYIYSDDVQDMGNCKDDDEFFKQYEFLIAEKLRITKPGCLSAVHCKNLVNYAGRDGMAGLRDFRGEIIRAHVKLGWAYHSEITIWKDPVIEMQRTKAQGLLYKQLRQNSKFTRMGMAEYLMVFRKWGEGMNENPVTHTKDDFTLDQWQKWASPVWMDINQTKVLNGRVAREDQDEKHICPLQLDVIERAITLWSNPGDLVYSPFTGIGSEGYGALKLGRRFVGSELKKSYADWAVSNMKSVEAQPTLF